MNKEIIEYILLNRPDLGVVNFMDGIPFDIDGKEVTLDIPAIELEMKTKETKELEFQTIATIESIYSKQVMALFKRASALPSQPVRRLTATGQATQNLVYQTNQIAESLGLITILSDVQKQAMVAILPWLQLASKLCDKLTTSVLAGEDVQNLIDLAGNLNISKAELTADKLTELKTTFGIV